MWMLAIAPVVVVSIVHVKVWPDTSVMIKPPGAGPAHRRAARVVKRRSLGRDAGMVGLP
jgi:hypothetical protein